MLTIPIIQDKLFFEMTPLIPTCEYSNDSGSFMPYAQLRISEIQNSGIEIDLTAFVTHPEVTDGDDFIANDDLMAISMNLNPDNTDNILTFICNASNSCIVMKNGTLLDNYQCERRSGEDERGIYWSIKIVLPPDFLQKHFGLSTLTGVNSVRCNAFKAKMKHPHKHFGAVAPFKTAYDLCTADNLAEFKVINM